jgi:hypothetical protein
MFDNDDKTAGTEGVTVSAVTSDEEDERCVTQLPGGDHTWNLMKTKIGWNATFQFKTTTQGKFGFSTKLVACSSNDQRKAFLTIAQGVI